MKRIILSLASAVVFAAGLAAQPEIRSQWEGRKVAFLGDSITDSHQIARTNNIYWHFLEDILGIEPYVYGISGHKMNQIIGQGQRLEAEHGQDVDAILVFIGTNDFNGNVPVGDWYTYSMQKTIDDGPAEVVRRHRELVYDDNTFKGRANTTMRWLKTHYPDKQIIFLTPIHRAFARFSDMNIQPDESFANASGYFIDDYVQAVREMASVWAVPVIDLNSISGLYPLLDEHTAYFRNPENDRLHPNTPGQLRMAYSIAYQLLGYPACFPKYLSVAVDSPKSAVTSRQLMKVLKANGITPETTAGKEFISTARKAEFAADPEMSVKDGDIIVVDDSDASAALLEKALPALKGRGFTFLGTGSLFGIRGRAPEEGRTYDNAYR